MMSTTRCYFDCETRFVSLPWRSCAICLIWFGATASWKTAVGQHLQLDLVGQWGGSNFAVAAQGNYVYAGVGPRVLTFDVSDPERPLLVGRSDVLPDIVRGIALSGDYCYVADGDAGLQILNVADPARPLRIGAMDTGYATNVVVSGAYLFLSGQPGLQIISVANPSAPYAVSNFVSYVWARGVAVSGNYAYLVHDFGFEIVNISDRASPYGMGSMRSPRYAYSVAVAGEYAYVGYDDYQSSDGFVRIINVADPNAPYVVAARRLYSSDRVWALSISGKYVYAGASDGIHIFDVSLANNPVFLKRCNTSGSVFAIDLQGGNAFVATSIGPQGIALDSCTGKTLYETSSCSDIAASGDYIYSVGSIGFAALNIADHMAPYLAGHHELFLYPSDLGIVGNHAYTLSSGGASIYFRASDLAIFDISDPSNPARINEYSDWRYFEAQRIIMSQNLQFIVGRSNATGTPPTCLFISDNTDPLHAVRLWSECSTRPIRDLVVRGNYLYLVRDTFDILNIEKPSSPTIIGTVDRSYSRIDVLGHYAYLVTEEGRLDILDVSKPTLPQILGNCEYGASSYPRTVSATSQYAFIADSGMVHAVNVADPLSPFPIAELATSGSIADMEVHDNSLYLADGSGGLVIVQTSPVTAVLQVSPDVRVIDASGGTAAFAVLNDGGGTMDWIAEMTSDGQWMRVVSSASGVNDGILVVSFDPNPNPESRTSKIHVSAPGALPPSLDVTVVQAGTAPPPQVTHFEFDLITGPYNVNESIPITITAMNANATTASSQVVSDFSGTIIMNANAPCPITQTIPMFFGEAKGEIKCDQNFPDTILTALSSGISGTSNRFTVGAATAPPGSISGHVKVPPAFSHNLQVQVVDGAGTVVRSLDAAPISRAFHDSTVPPGTYTVQALGGPLRSVKRRITVRSQATVSVGPLKLLDPTKPPVLLVGGGAGSTLPGYFVYPSLGKPGDLDRLSIELVDPWGAVWGKLRSTIDPYFTPIDTPWDWRKKIGPDLVRDYIIDAIDEAKSFCDPPCPKVDIVAHSLGNILVRHYIQSPDYRSDIRKYAMCGPANGGANFSYYIWEGGDPIAADKYSGWSWLDLLFPDFYTHTVELAYLAIEKTSAFWFAPGRPRQLVNNEIIRDFIHKNAPGIFDLVPVTPFLQINGSPCFSAGANCSELIKLAKPSKEKERLQSTCTTQDCVKTRIFLSHSEQTFWQIQVDGHSGSCPDVFNCGDASPFSDASALGPPVKVVEGDGTILKSSALFGLGGQVQYDDSEDTNHVNLMNKYADKICTFLNGAECPQSVASAVQNSEIPGSAMSVFVTGRVQAHLTSPANKTSGVRFKDGIIIDEIEDSQVVVTAERASFFVSDPPRGTYSLCLTALPEEVFSIDVDFSNHHGLERERVQGIHHDRPVCVRISLNPDASPAILFDSRVDAPSSVRSVLVDGDARIEWDASGVPGSVIYNVYSRRDEEPKFTLLGSTTETSFHTGHPWNRGGLGKRWHYFVTAKAPDGTESLFNEVVENRLPLVARFSTTTSVGIGPLAVTFSDESLGEVMAWAWDFESDGVIDSTAQNPTVNYTMPGSYTVTLIVGGPEGTDTSIRPGFIRVDPLVPPDPPVPGDFDADFDVDAADLAAFVERMNGPFADPTIAGWHMFDLDPDYDVDLRDFAALENVFTGE